MVVERSVAFTVGSAFYRPQSQLSRDFGVLAAIVQRQTVGQLRVLDAMSGCGVRALRYLQEAAANFVWVNEANPELQPVLQENLQAIASERYQITDRTAQDVLHQLAIARDYFDLIELDVFGKPLTFLPAAIQALKLGGLLYVANTDGRSLSGQQPEQSVQQWGAVVRSHPAVHEQALRVLIGVIAQQATIFGYGIRPILSYFSGQVWRVLVQLQPKPQTIANGWLGYCHRCGEFQTVDWRSLGRARCDCAPNATPTISGPLWLGPLHDREILQTMQQLAQTFDWQDTAALLTTMQSEADLPPYFYTLGEIGRRGKMDIPRRDRLTQALQTQGFRCEKTHIHPAGIKTTASFADCLATARSL
jgi:tRNA (guanine26-N2/guanine27-N2)-dimethyltransferase